MRFLLFIIFTVSVLGAPPMFRAQNVPSGFTPSAISGLVLWLDADTISGGDTDPVSTWEDQSASGNDATQGTGSRQPTLQTAEVNGHNAVQADGTDDLLTLASSIDASGSYTIFTLQKRTGSTSLAAALGNGLAGPDVPYSPIEYGPLNRLYAGTQSEQKYTTIPSHDWHVLTLVCTSGVITLYVDGSVQSLTDAASTTSADFDRVFSRGTPTSEYWAIYLSDLLVYNSALGSADREAVEAYLLAKGGL